MNKERIIIRREYNPYRKRWGYIVGYPEAPTNKGRISTNSCHFDSFGRFIVEASCEVDKFYFLNRKLVHKNTADALSVKDGLENVFDQEFEVVEKIVKGMEAY